MNDLLSLFTATESVDIFELGLNLILATVMAALVRIVFIRFGNTASNRRQFGRIFFMVTVCTTLIIAVIKSSIALSLGLVGALSIVRFRAAIKEPEELAYLFLCVAIGLGFGAGLRVVTLFSAILIMILILIHGLFSGKAVNHIYNFSVLANGLSIDEVVNIIRPFTNSLKVRRVDSDKEKINLMLAVEFKSLVNLENVIGELKSRDENTQVSFVSNETFLV
jgi:uncharacterized membrane protein YhiD involved in acid resistance